MNITRTLYRLGSFSALTRAVFRGPWALTKFFCRRVLYRIIWRAIRKVTPL